jgi:hypothetical protein
MFLILSKGRVTGPATAVAPDFPLFALAPRSAKQRKKQRKGVVNGR